MFKKVPHEVRLVTSSFPDVLSEEKVPRNGFISVQKRKVRPEKICNMPDPSAFDLENMLIAGVPLTEVNTKLLTRQSLTSAEETALISAIDKELEKLNPDNNE